MVRLSHLVGALGGTCTPSPQGTCDPDLADVHIDSRRVGPGELFAALPGLTVDGARFVPEALGQGASAVLSPQRLLTALDGETRPNWVHPAAPRIAGEAAAMVHGNPARTSRIVGITGTNGKTTVAHLVGQLATAAGFKPAVIGTVGHRLWGAETLPATHTTPDATELQRLLAENLRRGGDSCACELSSHALDQCRAAGLELDVAVFTNLSRDHLEYHGTMEAYAAAKAEIFRLLKVDGVAVINDDDPAAPQMIAAAQERGARVVRFGIGSRCDLCVSRVRIGREGSNLFLDGMGILGKGLTIPLAGRHNLENAIAAAAAVMLMGASSSKILEGLATVFAPPGRLEPIDTAGRGFACFVDYAHTPEALANALEALRPWVGDGGRLIVVFGCGGDRDAGKRAPMGGAAAAAAEVVLVTSDNPRDEDPEAIAHEVARGATTGDAEVEVIVERRAAIRRALDVADEGDVVLIAGKGHEQWQQLRGSKLAFDDRRVVAEELER